MKLVLEPTLKNTPIRRLILRNNNIGCDQLRFVERVLEGNSSVNAFSHWEHYRMWARVTFSCSLVAAARKHTLNFFSLRYCNVGHLLHSEPYIVADLLSVKALNRNPPMVAYICDHFRSRAHVITYRISKNQAQNASSTSMECSASSLSYCFLTLAQGLS